LGALIRHKLLAVAIVLLALLVAGSATALQIPVYLGRATVLMENRRSKVIGEVEIGQYMDREEFRAQQVLAFSKPVLMRAAELYSARRQGSGATPEQARAMLGGGLLQTRVEGRLLVLEVMNPDPVKAADLVNEWAQAFVEESLHRALVSMSYVRDFLGRELPPLREQWKQKREEMQKFQLDHQYFPHDGHPVMRQFPSLGEELTQVRVRLAAIQSEVVAWDEAKGNSAKLLQGPRARKDAALNSYESMIQQQRRKILEARQTYKPDSEELQKAEKALAEMEGLREQALQALEAQLQIESRTAEEAVKRLEGHYREAEQEYNRLKSLGVKYSELDFDCAVLQKQCEELSRLLEDAKVAGRVEISSAQVWERADPPGAPYRPSWRRNMAVGLILGLLMAAAAVLVRENFDDSVYSSGQLQVSLGLNVLGTVPLLERRWRREGAYTLAKDHPRAMPVESLRALRSSLAVSYCNNGSGSLFLVTSPGESEGKSFLASNLATLFAVAGKKALLVDMDLYKSTLSLRFGFGSHAGITTLLSQQRPLSELAVETMIPGLYFLPAGPASTNPAAAIESGGFHDVLDQARATFEVVILDAPPVLAVADTCAVAAKCDTVVLTMRSRITRLTQVDRAVEILQRAQARECVCILNGLDAADAEVGGYGYSYYYKYGYGYGKYGHRYGYGYGLSGRSRRELAARNEQKMGEAEGEAEGMGGRS
jgi:capsular exopolysaccharide synthesis family protein